MTGPCRVLAGPGSGKTHVMIRRILYLITNADVPPSQILAVTFSRAAALQMQQRFYSLCLCPVSFSTLHALCYQILREESGCRCSVIGGAEKSALLRHLAADCCSAEEQNVPDLIGELAFYLSRQKESGQIPPYLPVSEKAFRGVRDGYDRWMRENGKIDFSDMITDAAHLLKERPGILAKWQKRFSFFLVDEFQDLSDLQYELIRRLSAHTDNLFVVGDDDQSIYAFRGASPSVLQRFAQDYPDCRDVHLIINYRCAEKIRRAADRVIRENRARIPKKSRAYREGGQIELQGFVSEKEELAFLAAQLKKLSPAQLEQTAVIVRTRVLRDYFLRSLGEEGIACRGASRDRSGVGTEVIGDIKAYFRFAAACVQGGARQDFYRIMNRPERYLTRDLAPEEAVTEASVLRHAGSRTETVRMARELFRDLKALRQMKPGSGLKYLMNTMGYRKYLQETGAKNSRELLSERMAEELMRAAAACSGPEQFVRYLDRAESLPQQPELPETEDRGVSVLTMHASKGLEYDRVFLPELNEGIIPGRRTASSQEGEEEERRLFYVAMTRARKELNLYYISGTPQNPRAVSRFLLPLISLK